MNPEKTDGGLLISSHACFPETAADEFMLYRQEYLNTTGRKRGDEVLAYHLRQAFKPGKITAEKANEIGKALAERLTDKQHAFVVATHIDKQHIHNHIIFCATSLDGRQKYRDVKRSAKELVQISDALCGKTDYQLSAIHRIKLSHMTSGRSIGKRAVTGMTFES